MTGAERIASERQRQIDVEGYSSDHDYQHDDGALAIAADCYLTWGTLQVENQDPVRIYGSLPDWWPWEPRDWKPSDDPIRNFEKAGALIAAEMDRLIARTAKP